MTAIPRDLVVVINSRSEDARIGFPQDIAARHKQIRAALRTETVTFLRLNNLMAIWARHPSPDVPTNAAATAIASRYGWSNTFTGPVVVCGLDGDGNPAPLSDAQMAALRSVARSIQELP